MLGKRKEYKEKRNLLSMISENLLKEDADSDQPFFVQNMFKGYTTASFAFAGAGVIGGILLRSDAVLFLGFLLALITGFLGHMQKKAFANRGYEFWRFEVLEYTWLTKLNRRPTGIYAEALDGPYEGRICHLALPGQGVIPQKGRIIDVCVPGNTEASLIRDIYYIPTYYGMDLAREE